MHSCTHAHILFLQVPILFLHGVGLGLFPYIVFVARLTLTGQPVIAFECDHLGMRWVPRIPDADEVVHNIIAVLEKHGVPCACVSVSACVRYWLDFACA